MDAERMSIGQFARLCRLSRKQLRHYDELGLLTPDWIDPTTGYRYYRAGQARDAVCIALLRSLDVPLPAIADVLGGCDLTTTLGAVRDSMEADLARRTRALASLERVLSTGLPSVEVGLRREHARRVVITRGAGAVEEVGSVTADCVARLTSALLAAGREPGGPIVGVFPLDLGDQVPVTVAAVVDGEVPGTTSAVLPGGLFAVATHLGPYDQIAMTTHALLARAGEHGHVPAGDLREVYLSDPANSAPEQLVTRLMMRIEED